MVQQTVATGRNAKSDPARIERILGLASEPSAEALGGVYQAELASDRAVRQQAAAFYTPPHLVDFTTELALGPVLANASIDEVLSIRVADPACGTGVFLAAARRAMALALKMKGVSIDRDVLATITRNCLHGVDVDPVAARLCQIALASDTNLSPDDVPILTGDSLARSVQVADVVIANPPWGQKNLHFEKEQKDALRARFKTAKGVLDPFKLFVELAISMVSGGGRWAMVLPDIVLLKNHELTRRLMLESSSLEWIAHVGRAFHGVNLDACVISGRVPRDDGDNLVKTATTLDQRWPAVKPTVRLRAQRTFTELPNAKFNIVATDDELARVEQLRSLPRVGERFELHEGVHTGNRRSRLFIAGPRMPSTPLVVGGGELEPFRLGWSGRYIDLDPEAVERGNGGYANLGRPEWHARKKIVIRRTGDRMVAAFDSKRRYFSNNFFVVIPRDLMTDDEQRATVAVLGSAFMTWYFRVTQPRVGRLFAELKISLLSDFPLATLTRSDVQRLAGLVRQLERPGLPKEARGRVIADLDQHVASTYDRILR